MRLGLLVLLDRSFIQWAPKYAELDARGSYAFLLCAFVTTVLFDVCFDLSLYLVSRRRADVGCGVVLLGIWGVAQVLTAY